MKKFTLLFFAFFMNTFLTACTLNNHVYQGYVEGKYRYISSNFSGVLENLFVSRGDSIAQGKPLFILEPQPQTDILNQAKANLTQATAQKAQQTAALSLAKITLDRRITLLQKKSIQQEMVDEARSTYQQTEAQLQQAESQITTAQAALAQAEWSVQQKSIAAPVSGLVFETYFLPGELVPANSPVLSLLAPQDIKIIFYVPEKTLGTLAIGQALAINCDACASTVTAKIVFISPRAEYTPPVIYSNDMRSKLVFRIEAKPINLADAPKLHPGEPVEVTLR